MEKKALYERFQIECEDSKTKLKCTRNQNSYYEELKNENFVELNKNLNEKLYIIFDKRKETFGNFNIRIELN